MEFVRTLPVVDYKTISDGNYSLSAAQYRGFSIKNTNRKKVRDFMSRPLTTDDLGEEVGSLNYIGKSPKKFLKTKALQPHSFVPDLTSESVENVRPSCFVDKRLCAGDIIISKDSNIGEAVILDRDYPDMMLSGALYKLPAGVDKYYLFAFLKHQLFKEQLDYMTPKGSVIRHCKTLFLDCEIPMPNREAQKTIEYVGRLVKSIVRKERLIRERHDAILKAIDAELNDHQKKDEFLYRPLTYAEAKELGRLDAKPYCESFKRMMFKVRNYQGGYKTISELGFSLSRGQNLQVSNIGDSIYSEVYYPGFYTLMLPKFLSKYGTCEKVEYLGNPRSLKILKPGDLIFGAEGFEKGRSIVIVEPNAKTITNIHGITIQHPEGGDIVEAVFVKCFLDYLRNQGMIDMLAVGGNGGSLAQKYWSIIPFPNFHANLKKAISMLYYNQECKLDFATLTDDNFESANEKFERTAGVSNLDNAVKHFKSRLNAAITQIANDEVACLRY